MRFMRLRMNLRVSRQGGRLMLHRRVQPSPASFLSSLPLPTLNDHLDISTHLSFPPLPFSLPTWMASSTSSLPFPCKWGFCTDRFSEKGILRAHVQTHILAEKFIRTEELDVEMRNGQCYAREKESQGFGTFLQEQPHASTSNFVSQPSTSSSSSHSQPPSILSQHTDESLAQPFTEPSQTTTNQPPPAFLGPPITSAQPATTVVSSPSHTNLSSASDLIPHSPGTASSSASHSPSAAGSAAVGTPSPKRRTSGGFGTLPLGKKSVFGFGRDALRFGFGGGGGGGGEGSASSSSPSSGVAPASTLAVPVAEVVVVESEKHSSQDSNATRASLTSSTNQTSPSSLGAQTQLEIQAVLAAQHSSQQQQHSSSPPSPSQHEGSQSSPPSSPHSFLGRQTQGEFTNRRHTPFPSSPPSNANDFSPSPTSQHRFLSPSAYEDDQDQDEEDLDGDEMMKEFLVDDFESVDGERTKGKKRAGGSSDAEQEDLVEDELMTQAIPRKGR
ncbi:hypothetical protein BDY24DRAFT_44628 [Mrakia frigida]|uniref:uncharacterized protein n=1 Tax=Mrakia frigida TaxID=29902 RepID=UPI003FCC173D